MRLAAARAGLWFFWTIVIVFIFGASHFKDASLGDTIGTLLIFATIVAGIVFFWTWYSHEVKQQLNEGEMKDTPR